MNRRIALFALLCFCALGAAAQQQQRFKPDEFRAQLEHHIIKEARLTREEADKFFPIFNEMKEKQRQIAQKAQELKRKCPSTDKEAQEQVNKIAELGVQQAKVEKDYYAKLLKVVPARKLLCALTADDGFHRQMVQKMAGGGQPKQGQKKEQPKKK